MNKIFDTAAFRIGLRVFITIILFFNIFIINLAVNAEEEPGKKQITKEFYTSDEWYQSYFNYSTETLDKSKIPVEAKGLYLTGNTAGGPKFDQIIDLLNKTELNSLVIDVKQDSGYITYKSNVKEVNEIKSDRITFIKDIDKLMHKAKENNIYTIARIVTFKDPFYAGSKPEIAMQKKNGGVWKDRSGVIWVDPYNKTVWDYNIAIAKEAAEKGFDEIQFDYVRFPENGKKVDLEVAFNNPENRSKAQNIADFLAYAKEQLKDYPVFISADVFGLTTTVVDDMGIGQQWELITPVVDYISPMMYPSHYANRTYGLPVPDQYPYETIKFGLIDALSKNKKVAEQQVDVSTIRPWYQDFTATWVKGHISYGSKEVSQQIQAGYDLGVRQYMIWDSKNVYSQKAWLKE